MGDQVGQPNMGQVLSVAVQRMDTRLQVLENSTQDMLQRAMELQKFANQVTRMPKGPGN
eukprot:m.333097 g.333097  ORF g.333097 m.333097 type:complete len:59 (+) comp17068_c0_seq1:49-225(+)